MRAVVTEVRAGSPPPPDVVDAYAERWTTEGGRKSLLGALAGFRLVSPEDRYQAHRAAANVVGRPFPQHSVLVIWGEEDPWFPVEQATVFADALPGSKVVVVPGVGHLAHEQEPELVYGEIVAAFDGKDDPLVETTLDRDGLVQWLKSDMRHRRSFAAEAMTSASMDVGPRS